MDWLTRAISAVSPSTALKRAQAAARLAHLEHYAAAQQTRYRTVPRDEGSGANLTWRWGRNLRDAARRLERDDPTVAGIIRHLGGHLTGCTIMPTVLNRAGELADETNQELASQFEAWRDQAEASGLYSWADLCATVGESAVRDGECFTGLLYADRSYAYPTQIPLAISLLESEMVDWLRDSYASPHIRQGVEFGPGGRVEAWHVYTSHPGDRLVPATRYSAETVRVPADAIAALQFLPRAGMVRGVSLLASSLTTLQDVSEYLDSERIAAKLAACLGVQIIRSPDAGTAPSSTLSDERTWNYEPGMVFDDLMPGERVEMVGSNRPNDKLAEYLRTQFRRSAVGTGSVYSTVSGDYDGTYSSQRQMLVEARPAQMKLHAKGVARLHRPVWQRFVQSAVLAGLVPLRNVDPRTLYRADFVPLPQPWIDPSKEVDADVAAIEAGLDSRVGTIRRRGGDPRRIDAERRADPQPGTPTRIQQPQEVATQ